MGEDLACPDVDLLSLLFVEAVSVWIWLCLRVIVLLGGESSLSLFSRYFFALIVLSIFASLKYNITFISLGCYIQPFVHQLQ